MRSSIPSQKQVWDRLYKDKSRIWGNAPVEFGKVPFTGRVLELGIGDGKNIRTRMIADADIIGVDISLQALRRLGREFEKIYLLAGDAIFLPFRPVSFDQIHAHHILGHLPQSGRLQLMQEVFRTMKPGGEVYLTVFGRGDLRDGKGERVEENSYIRGDGVLIHYFSYEEIQDLFQAFRSLSLQKIEWEMVVQGTCHPRILYSGLFRKDGSLA